MSKYLFTLALFCSCLVCLIPQSRAQSIYKKISPACIEILVGGRLDGSGVIVCPTGLVLTACHVIRKPSKRLEAFSPKVGRKALLTDNEVGDVGGEDVSMPWNSSAASPAPKSGRKAKARQAARPSVTYGSILPATRGKPSW